MKETMQGATCSDGHGHQRLADVMEKSKLAHLVPFH